MFQDQNIEGFKKRGVKMDNYLIELNKLLFSNFDKLNNEEEISNLEKIILKALIVDQRRYNEKVPFQVSIKTKSSQKKFKEIYPGQIFELFIKDINKFVYGVIVFGNYLENKYDDIIITFLKDFYSKPLQLERIYKLIENKDFLMFANTGLYAIVNREWKYVGNYPFRILEKEELEKIEYSTKFMNKYYKSIGDSNREIGDCEIITEQQAKSILNPLGIIGDKELENILIKTYKY